MIIDDDDVWCPWWQQKSRDFVLPLLAKFHSSFLELKTNQDEAMSSILPSPLPSVLNFHYSVMKTNHTSKNFLSQ